MSFTVIWKPVAERQLAELWLNAEDRTTFTFAAEEVEARLRTAPVEFGESRDDFARVAVVRPLVVHFEVHEEDRMVSVLSVRSITTRWM